MNLLVAELDVPDDHAHDATSTLKGFGIGPPSCRGQRHPCSSG